MFVLTRPYTVVSVLIKVNKDYWVKTVFFSCLTVGIKEMDIFPVLMCHSQIGKIKNFKCGDVLILYFFFIRWIVYFL